MTATTVDQGSITVDPGAATVERPTGREEAWRFTPLARLGGLLAGTAGSAAALDIDVDVPAGVVVGTDGGTDDVHAAVLDPVDAPAWHAVAQAPNGLVLTVPPGSTPDRPIAVTLRGRSTAEPSYAHVRVDVQRGATAVLVLDHVGSSVTSAFVELLVGDGAHLSVVTVQEQGADGVLALRQAARIGRDGVYRHASLTIGGDLVRLVPTVAYAGPGGDAELSGVFFTSDGQHHESRLFVDHAQPQCRSRVAYKGALTGEAAHSVWIGDVLIRAEAVGTDTYEYNRNLVLTDGARADSVPNLEIETGEIVGAGHASATGRFDDEQLFYLMSRGIDEGEARRLVVRGFFAEVLDRVGAVVPELTARLAARVEELV